MIKLFLSLIFLAATLNAQEGTIECVNPILENFRVQLSSGTNRGAVLLNGAIPTEMEVLFENGRGNYFGTTTGEVPTSGVSETPIILAVNLSTNTKSIILESIFATSLDGVTMDLKFYGQPTITSSGTTLNIFIQNSNFSGNVSLLAPPD